MKHFFFSTTSIKNLTNTLKPLLINHNTFINFLMTFYTGKTTSFSTFQTFNNTTMYFFFICLKVKEIIFSYIFIF